MKLTEIHVTVVRDDLIIMNLIEISDHIARELERNIQDLPEGFFDSFRFTKTGNNLTHPWTWGVLTKILWGIHNIKRVGLDVRLNTDKVKFQPDLVGYNFDDQPVVFLDYESPNSSDARIPIKDVDPYLEWSQNQDEKTPYIIITTLLDHHSSNWELRYASSGKYNYEFRDKRQIIRKNPCRFWYDFYFSEFHKRKISGISLLNISRKTVVRKFP